MSTNSEPSSDQQNPQDDITPLWRYVTKEAKLGKGGGNVAFQCNFCRQTYRGSYYRVKAHLLKIKGGGISSCSKVTNENLVEMRRVVEESEQRVKHSNPKQVLLPTSSATSSNFQYSSTSGSASAGPKRIKGAIGSIEKAFNMGAREIVDSEIARMFYTGGLSFHFARNPYYVRAFKSASQLPGYIPPGYNALRTTLLQKEKTNIENLLEPIKKTWNEKGVSICSDGWSDAQRRSLINIMAVSEGGPMFLKTINCEGETKDKHFIADLLINTIQEIGPQKVVQVITDNAAACKAAGHIVDAEFRHIFWTPCVVHTLNLALKNICAPSTHPRYDDVMEQCGWISSISSDVSFIKNFIMNHAMRLSMFNHHCNLKLLSVADTRFASTIVMLKRFKTIKRGLEQLVISEEWEMYKEDDVVKAKEIKDKILNEDFWMNVDYILSFTSPIYEMLRLADTDRPCLHNIYEWWDSMIEKVKETIYKKEQKRLTENSRFFDIVNEILVERWTKSHTPLHCLAHSLNLRHAIGVDVDSESLEVASENAEFLECDLDLIQCDVRNLEWRGRMIDTVVMNPPFGTRNKGADKIFLSTALKIARGAVYSLHKTTTREYVRRAALKEFKATSADVLCELRFDVPKMYKFHSQKEVDIAVDLWRFVPPMSPFNHV